MKTTPKFYWARREDGSITIISMHVWFDGDTEETVTVLGNDSIFDRSEFEEHATILEEILIPAELRKGT